MKIHFVFTQLHLTSYCHVVAQLCLLIMVSYLFIAVGVDLCLVKVNLCLVKLHFNYLYKCVDIYESKFYILHERCKNIICPYALGCNVSNLKLTCELLSLHLWILWHACIQWRCFYFSLLSFKTNVTGCEIRNLSTEVCSPLVGEEKLKLYRIRFEDLGLEHNTSRA